MGLYSYSLTKNQLLKKNTKDQCAFLVLPERGKLSLHSIEQRKEIWNVSERVITRILEQKSITLSQSHFSTDLFTGRQSVRR